MRVLVVEDEELLREVVSKLFRKPAFRSSKPPQALHDDRVHQSSPHQP
jgi:hypothetical protein